MRGAGCHVAHPFQLVSQSSTSRQLVRLHTAFFRKTTVLFIVNCIAVPACPCDVFLHHAAVQHLFPASIQRGLCTPLRRFRDPVGLSGFIFPRFSDASQSNFPFLRRILRGDADGVHCCNFVHSRALGPRLKTSIRLPPAEAFIGVPFFEETVAALFQALCNVKQ